MKKIRYLFEYIVVITLFKIFSLFGIDRSANICSFIARKIGPLLSFDKIARKNIKRVLDSKLDIEDIITQTWDNFGRFIGEFPYVNKMPEEEINKRIKITGFENIIKFQENNQPFIIFTGHFANWDMALKIINKLYPKFAVIYRKANNPYVDGLINNTRNDENIRLIPKGPSGVRNLISSIRAGFSIAMLVDQKMNDGIEVPLLGQPAMTPNAIAKIALQFKYPIIPCQIVRSKGSYFEVIIHPELGFEQTGDDKKDGYNIMVSINQILGTWINQNPSQWFWFHNRWKK